jgi:hypothetical protein
MTVKKLGGINEECRNYVAYPLTRIPVPESPSQPAGGCFIYHYINGIKLVEYTKGKSYAQRLIICN